MVLARQRQRFGETPYIFRLMEAVEELISEHNHQNALNYTPIQVNAFLFFARRRQKRNMRNQISMMAVAFRGSQEQLANHLKDLGRE